MATTSVHFDHALLARLDAASRAAGISRNRFIREACEAFLDRAERAWPADYASQDRLSDDDLAELRRGADELWRSIEASRTAREESPF